MTFMNHMEKDLLAWLEPYEEVSNYIKAVSSIVAKLQYPTYLDRVNILECFNRYEIDTKSKEIIALFETSARSDDAYEVRFPWFYLWTANFQEMEVKRLQDLADEMANIRAIEDSNKRILYEARKEENERRMYERLKLKYERTPDGGQHMVS